MPMLSPTRTGWPSMTVASLHRGEHPVRQCFGRAGLLAVGGDHDEFVAAEPGQESAADRGLQAPRHLAQQLVAGRVADRRR